MFDTYHTEDRPEYNPLIGASLQETAGNCIGALRWIMCIDPERLDDRAVRDGLYSIVEPILGALECSVAREEDCITLSPEDSARLHAFAREHCRSSISTALNAALDTAETQAAQCAEAEIKPDPDRDRRYFEQVRDLAEKRIADLIAQAQAEQEGAQS